MIGPQVNTEALVPVHKDDCSRLATENLRKIKSEYASLFALALYVLQEKNINMSILRGFLIALYSPDTGSNDTRDINFNQFIDEVLGTAHTVGAILESLMKYGLLSYTNFYVLRDIINHFAADDIPIKRKLDEYEQKLTGYMLVTKMEQYLHEEAEQSDQSEPDLKLCDDISDKTKANIIEKILKYLSDRWGLHKQPRPDPKLLVELSFKMKANITEKTMKYVMELWESLAKQVKLPVTALMFHRVAKGCVEITWLLPCHLTDFTTRRLLESTDYFQVKNIIQVTIANMCVYKEHPALQDSTRVEDTHQGRKVANAN